MQLRRRHGHMGRGFKGGVEYCACQSPSESPTSDTSALFCALFPSTNNKTNGRNNPMKTNSNATSRIGLGEKYLMLLFAAVTLAFGAHSAWASDQVPFKGRAEGAVVGMAPDPAGVVLTALSDGNATQLGRFSREEMVLLNPMTGALAGVITFTAANGDQLRCTFAGGFISPTTATGTYTFTGGTGRFENAAGSATFVASTPDGIHLSVKFEGTLSSVGSNTH